MLSLLTFVAFRDRAPGQAHRNFWYGLERKIKMLWMIKILQRIIGRPAVRMLTSNIDWTQAMLPIDIDESSFDQLLAQHLELHL